MTRSTPLDPKMVGKLHRRLLTRVDLRRRKLLLKTNKTRNITIKKIATGVEEMMGTGHR